LFASDPEAEMKKQLVIPVTQEGNGIGPAGPVHAPPAANALAPLNNVTSSAKTEKRMSRLKLDLLPVGLSVITLSDALGVSLLARSPVSRQVSGAVHLNRLQAAQRVACAPAF